MSMLDWTTNREGEDEKFVCFGIVTGLSQTRIQEDLVSPVTHSLSTIDSG